MAPEQLAGARPTSAVDIFAWAVTMIYAATGRLAFGADSVPAVMHRILYEEPDVSGLPPSLRPVVLECLDKDPARRPSARDLLLRLVDPSAQRAAAAAPGPPAAPGPATWTSGPAALADSGRRLGRGHRAGVPARRAYRSPGAYAGPAYPGDPAAARPRGPGGGRSWPPAAVAAAAVIALAVVLLTRGSPPASPAGSGGSALAGSASSPAASAPAASSRPASSPAATTGATIPAAFAGTWKGTGDDVRRRRLGRRR